MDTKIDATKELIRLGNLCHALSEDVIEDTEIEPETEEFAPSPREIRSMVLQRLASEGKITLAGEENPGSPK
jgi:hypothetical protein